MRALISVYDKTGLEPFARGLAEVGFELVASGGTAEALEGAGLAVTRVEDVTGFPELLGGRVKTLHPKIHGGILARRDVPDDLAALAEHGIAPFDLVCVNLYPFERAAQSPDATYGDVVEMIDVGGPALLRAAAKSHADVTAVCRPQDYDAVLAELRESGQVTPMTRVRLAGTAFATTAAYDAAIARWLHDEEAFPETLTARLRRGAAPQLRREPAPAGLVLRRARRAHPPALTGRAAPGQAALVQQPERPLGGSAAPARARTAGLRDRQARESLRRRGRRDDRAGVRASRSPRIPCRRTEASSS